MPEEPTAQAAPRIVVGVSSSPASRLALAWAVDEARLRGAVLHAVFAWQYPFELADGTYVPPVPNTELGTWAVKVLDEELAAVGVDDVVEVRRDTPAGPATAALMEASEGADLLVVGTSGHGRLTGLLLGSTSQFLSVHAPCPVVVVHGPHPAHDAAEAEGGVGGADLPARADATAQLGELEVIGEEECLALLAGTNVGRLAVVVEGQPLVFPVNYVLDGRTVAVRTDPGTKLEAASLGRVAFEVDRVDDRRREGWSVLVQGVGRDVTESIDEWSERIRQSGAAPWAAGDKRHWIAIAASSVSGRRITHRAEVGGGA